jgi:hypothetical protein
LNYSQVALVYEVPLFVDINSRLVGYGNICVNDLSVGVDGTLWAIDCNPDGQGNFNVIKWDPFVTQWYVVNGIKGVKVGAYNEISAAVVNS